MLAAIRKSWLLYTLFALFAVSSAIDVDGIGHFLHRGKRQAASGTGNSAAAPTSDDSKPSSAAAPSSQAPKTSNPPATSQAPAPSSNAPSPTPAPTNAQPSSGQGQQSSQAQKPTNAASSGNNAATSVQSEEVSTSPLVATSVQQFTTVIITTQSDGQQVSITSTGSSTNIITTGQATITSKPTTNNSNGNGGKGMPDKTKSIIGGVVGGVGGAVLLGGIALVCWRIWGRKKRVSEDDDDLMAGTGAALGDKPHGSGNSNTPFQSNLEQYHNPGGRPNAAANF